MKRISSLNTNIGSETYVEPSVEPSNYVVDDSSFIPISEALKQLGNVNADGSDFSGMYDFKDGKDTGEAVPFNRTSDAKDIAEISTHIADQVDSINEKVNNAIEKEKFKIETQKRMEAMRPTQSASSNPSN